MKEIKNNITHIKNKLINLHDLCQVVSVNDDLPLLITQYFDYIGTHEECWDKVNTTDVIPEKGSHLSVVAFKQQTVEREAWWFEFAALW